MKFEDLTDEERRTLAYAASVEASKQNDIRYCHPDEAEASRLLERWRKIAAMLTDGVPTAAVHPHGLAGIVDRPSPR